MTERVATEAIRAALKGFEPTAEQWRAIAHPLEPLHLIAGAGSGKTAIMAARIAWAIEDRQISPSQILGLTFTNKAADELEDRVRRALAVMGLTGRDEITVQTYHAFAASVVRDHGLLVSVEPESGLLSEAQQWQTVLSCIDTLPVFEAIELRTSAGLVRSTLALASSLADHMASVDDVAAAADRMLSERGANEDMITTARKRRELCEAVVAYTRAKRRLDRIDFGDQVTKAVEIFEGHDDVRAQYRERFRVVLLDEYQDTNVAQRKLMQALVGDGGAVTAVGDARQAIYAFRGATMYNLIGFPRHFPRAKESSYDSISLSQNFRSGSNILQAANSIVERIDEARRPGAPLQSLSSNGLGRVSLGLFSDERSEATWIAKQCVALEGARMSEGREEVRWRDLAILVRRKAAMNALIEAFADHDIPLEVVGLGGLLKTPEVIEIVAWLRCLETRPAANRWLARVLLGPRWRIHYRDLALCAYWAAGRNDDLRLRLAGGDRERAHDLAPGDVGFALVEALDHLDEIEGLGGESRRRLGEFASRLSGLRRKTGAPLLELVQEVIRVAGIYDALDASSSPVAAAAKQNVANFLDYVVAFAPIEGEASLKSLVAYLDAAEDAEETLDATQPAEQNSVKLMTVHAAKGLEFECVFVPSVAASKNRSKDYVWSIFPNTRSSNPLTSYTELPYEVREDGEHLPKWTGQVGDFKEEVKQRVIEDERRLFYVALTRAKQRLAVTASWWYGRDKRSKGPSQFWDELSELIDSGLVELVARDEEPQENPIYLSLESRRAWPPVPRSGIGDPLFPQGWGVAADTLIEGGGSLQTVVEMGPTELHEAERRLEEHLTELELIRAGQLERDRGDGPPTRIVSATELADAFAGKLVLDAPRVPGPERPGDPRRLGTEIHRLIEDHSRAAGEPWGEAAPYPEEGELDEPSGIEAEAVAERLKHFEDLGFADRRPARLPSGELMVELPFSLKWDDRVVRGRIDAVYRTDDGGYEIVDFKTGARFDGGEPGQIDQLEIYARALRANGLIEDGASVTLTYAFLDGRPPLSRTWKENRT